MNVESINGRYLVYLSKQELTMLRDFALAVSIVADYSKDIEGSLEFAKDFVSQTRKVHHDSTTEDRHH